MFGIIIGAAIFCVRYYLYNIIYPYFMHFLYARRIVRYKYMVFRYPAVSNTLCKWLSNKQQPTNSRPRHWWTAISWQNQLSRVVLRTTRTPSVFVYHDMSWPTVSLVDVACRQTRFDIHPPLAKKAPIVLILV